MKFRTASVLTALLCAAQITLSAPLALAAEAAVPARVSVAYAGMPLKDALRQFQEASGLRLAYAEDLLAGAAPVTLRLDDAPAERVLRELLRPQGLEAVLTDKNLAAIVPARSDLGMAKAFGRALDIGLRLGNKLDGAVVVGDEVKVPGWTAEDDEDMALGITDLIVSIAYFWVKMPLNTVNGVPVGQDERVATIQTLLRSADPLVRAGALTLLANFGVMNSEIREFGRAIEQGVADPHPAVRFASAFQFAAGIGNGQWQGQPEGEAATLRKLAADPEAGVRMAAALALLSNAHRPYANPAVDPDAALLDQLLADRSAFVRQTLRLGTLALNNPSAARLQSIPSYNWQGAISLNSPLMAHRAGPAQQKWIALNTDEGLKATLRDPNPIARAASFAFAQILQLGQRARDKAAPRDRVAEIWTEAELAKDPWMQTVHGLIAPALAGDFQVALETMVTALGSEKPSHQAAALLSLSLGSTLLGRGMPQAAARGEQPAPPKIPDLAPLTARLASSDWLWARLSGIALDTALPFVAPLSATPLPPEALQAAEDRLQAALRDPSEPMRLVALLAQSGRTMAGLPSQPEAILAALRGRRLPEILLGAQLANQGLAPERLLEEIKVLLDDPSRRIATEALLGGIWRNRSLLRVDNTARLDFARQLAEQVIARNDPAFDIAVFKNQWIWIQDTALREEMEERVLKSASLEAVAARYRNSQFETAQAVLLFDRMKAAAADPARRTAVLEAWAVLSVSLYYAYTTNPDVVPSLLDRAMAGEPADARASAARVRALPTLFSDLNNVVMQEQWAAAIERLPANLAKAMEQALVRAGEAEPSALTIDLLVEVLNAADNAGGVKRGWLREAWTANHPPLIQALDRAVQQVLAGTREADKIDIWRALARSGDKPAVEALAERILDGRVPDQTLVLALIAASENPGLLPPGFLPELIETIRDPAGNLRRRVQLVSVLNSCPGLWGNTLSEGLERLVWDDQAAVPLRSASLRMLISVLPNSDRQRFEAKRRAVIRQAVASYGTLPVAMIVDNLDGLTESGRFGEETLEEELLVLVLGDKRLRGENDWWTYETLFQRLAQSRGLETLQDPDRLRQALDKLEQEFPLVAQPPQGFQGLGLQALRKKLDQL